MAFFEVFLYFLEVLLFTSDVDCLLVDDDLRLHEVEETVDVCFWCDSTDHIPILIDAFKFVFDLLVKVKVLKIVDDPQVIDVPAVIAHVRVPTLPVSEKLFPR